MIERLDGMTRDIVKDNIEKLKELFPSIVTDKKINFRELELLLGQDVSYDKEQYSFVWNGKTEATKIAQKRSTGTLRPCEEESKNWDTTKNIYIEGDNLEVLKLLQSSYNGKIKMIYIDPPYNTGNDFVYKDDFNDNIANYKEITGQASKSNADTDGRYHTNWLNMMYPRLKLARNLLSDDGVIFISIDDNEQANLKKICDDVFGENNFACQFVWTKTATPPSLSHKCRKTVEYVLCYEKNLSNSRYFGSLLENGDAPLLNAGNPEKTLVFPVDKVKFNFIDNGVIPAGEYEKTIVLDDIEIKQGRNVNQFRMRGTFKWGQQMLDEEVSSGTYFIVKTDKFSIRFQRPFDELNFKTPNNFLNLELDRAIGIGTNESAVKELDSLDLSGIFDFPKPTSLISYLINMITKFDTNSIVLDFFSGSATTAHATMQLNSIDGGRRQFICVQLPEMTENMSKASELGFSTICEIGKERIRRAGDKVKAENPNATNLDIGFKVFKLDSSNLKKWNNTPTKDAEEVANRIRQISFDYLEDGRTEIDLVYEIMLKYGIDLTLPVTQTANGKGYIVNGEDYKLLVCSQMNIKLEDIEEFANESVGTYLFADKCFSDDNLLINTQEILKSKNKEMRLF